MIGQLLKLVLALGVVVGIGLSVYAYVGDLAPAPRDESLTVTLDAD